MWFRVFYFFIVILIIPLSVHGMEEKEFKNEIIQGILMDFQNIYFVNPKNRGKEFNIIIKDFDLGDKETFAIIDKAKRFWVINLPEKNEKYTLKGLACCQDFPLKKAKDELVSITRNKGIKQKFIVPTREEDLQ
jgi:hypothetical protein